MDYELVLGAVAENGLSVDFELVEPNGDQGDFEVCGSLKWDGCINWSTNEDCMAHFCGPETLAAFSAAMIEVWRQGGAALGDRYDKSAPRP